MNKHVKGIPFPVEAEIVESRNPSRRAEGIRVFNDITAVTRTRVSYITEVPTTASGYELLLEQLHGHPLCLEKVLVTHILPNTRDNTSPNLRVVVTTNTQDVPLEMSYLWWLDPTSVPLEDLRSYFRALRVYSTFPTVPTIEKDMSPSDWLGPRQELQRAIRQHRAFLYAGSSYPSMSPEDREHFLWIAESVPFQFDENPAILPQRYVSDGPDR